jgi:hypothetical protein
LFEEGYAPLARHAVLAEQAGCDFVEISDRFHRWFDSPQDGPMRAVELVSMPTTADRGHAGAVLGGQGTGEASGDQR